VKVLTNKADNKHKIAKVYFNKKWLVFVNLLDTFLSFLFAFKQPRPINHNGQQHKTILMLESHLIGDVIMGLPAYRAIREKFANAELIFWGNKWGKDLLEDQQLFNKFFIARIPWSTYDYSLSNILMLISQIRQLRRLQIDLAIDFRGDIRNIFLLRLIGARRRVGYDFTGGAYWLTDIVPAPGKWHLIERNLNVVSYLGTENGEDVPSLRVPEAKIQAAKKYFDNQGLRNIVFLHSGASQLKKLWPPERFARTVEYLDNKGYSPVLLSPPNDKSIVESIKNNCRITLPVLSVRLSDIAAYLACGEAFIGLDSGIGHIAAALGKNVIILFGPQLPSIACPRGSGKIGKVIKGDFACRPCHKQVCDLNNACMKAIQVEDVIQAIDEIKNV